MTSAPLARNDVIGIVRERFGTGSTIIDDRAFEFTLYDAFVVRIRADDYGSGGAWGIALHLGADVWRSTLLGQRLILRSTRDEVLDALGTLDAYCRLRLGEAYVTAYEIATGRAAQQDAAPASETPSQEA